MPEQKKEIEAKKFGPMSKEERKIFNDLENRVIKIETIFRTIGNVIKWTGIIIALISAFVGLLIKLGLLIIG